MKSPLGALPAIPAMTGSDRLGAVVAELRPASRTDSLPLAESAADNIIILSHHRRPGAEAPPIALPPDGRPAPAATPVPRPSPWLVLAGAVLLHLAMAVGFFRSPPPMASVGLEAISVEIVLGANQAAGLAQTQNELESSSVPSPASPEIKAERNEVARPEPEAAEAQQEAEKSEAEPAPTTAEARPTEPEAMTAEIRPENKEPPKPAVEKPKAQKQKKPKQAAPSVASVASAASGGIGQGRSSLDRNYPGMVAAHLARHKQYPAEARSRGITGTATITFALNGAGEVASVELVRSSGVPSLDTEAQEMVRRASPFPAPPASQGVSFTVPVNFNLR